VVAQQREFEGRTLDEAIETAAAATGRRGRDLEYEIIEEGRRGLARVGGRPFRIRVTLLEGDGRAADPGDGGAPGEGAPGGGGSEDDGPEITADPDEVVRLTDRILGGLGLDIKAKAATSEATIEVNLTGTDREYLLDRRGEALNALQYLLNRIIYRGRKGKRIHVDSDGFRSVREDEIVDIARRAAEKVIEQGEESVLSPLNPYERRLVHLALRDVEGVETQSLGDGFLKRIAIIPRKSGPNEDRRGR
jgi:spoIIIJ-associated protein